jgi:hypothetical protein
MRPSSPLAPALIGLALLGPGCVSLFPSPITPDTGKAAEGPRRNFLRIDEVRWRREAEMAVALSRDGVIRDHGMVLGTLRADGTFTSRDGKRTFVMDPDGTVHVAPGFDVQIGEDGTAVSRVHGQPDETVTLEKVKEPRGGKPGLTVEGMLPGLERTSMWILMVPDLLRLLANVDGE